MESKPAVNALAALAQDTRLAVYRQLVQAGPDGLAAGAIAEALSLPPATLSFHLKTLSHAGLLRMRAEGRSKIYQADFDCMNALLGYLTENCCSGADCGESAACRPSMQPSRRIAASSKRSTR